MLRQPSSRNGVNPGGGQEAKAWKGGDVEGVERECGVKGKGGREGGREEANLDGGV